MHPDKRERNLIQLSTSRYAILQNTFCMSFSYSLMRCLRTAVLAVVMLVCGSWFAPVIAASPSAPGHTAYAAQDDGGRSHPSPSEYGCSTPGEHYCCGTATLEPWGVRADKHTDMPLPSPAATRVLKDSVRAGRPQPPADPFSDLARASAFILFGNFRS